ncbi:MAG: hypothetical protein QHJ81_10850 [Anaerolineae bacterium]|nr:hypothetical protein [Anaerolineae bacterium]
MLHGLARGAIRCLDLWVRRGYGVYEFSSHPDCILRLAWGRSRGEMVLSDGTFIAAGERIGELHLWNERLPPMPPEGPDLRWAVAMHRGMVRSLRLLAAYVENDPAWAGIRAWRGETALNPRGEARSDLQFLEGLGLELAPAEPAGPLKRFTDFWENLYSWWLIWTFNPASLRSKRFWRLERRQVWISRATLLRRYGQRGLRQPDDLHKLLS